MFILLDSAIFDILNEQIMLDLSLFSFLIALFKSVSLLNNTIKNKLSRLFVFLVPFVNQYIKSINLFFGSLFCYISCFLVTS